MDAQESWWFAATEGLNGPHTQGEIFEAVRMGRVRSQTLVRLGEQGEWVPAAQAFPAAFPSSPTPPIGAGATPPRATAVPGSVGDLTARVDVGVAVFLSVITIGIYWDIWLYKRLFWYAQESGRPLGNRINYFWLFIGFLAAGLFLGLLSVGFFLFFLLIVGAVIASAVFSSLLINEIGKDQATITQRAAIRPMSASPATLVTLWVVGNAVGLTVVLLPVGIVLLVFFYIYFFRNHNAVIDSLAQDETH